MITVNIYWRKGNDFCPNFRGGEPIATQTFKKEGVLSLKVTFVAQHEKHLSRIPQDPKDRLSRTKATNIEKDLIVGLDALLSICQWPVLA
ncbi:MAG: hypothetical protein CR994_05630 [Maribacter sp.]|nr:MAG: hypothetical protein CR994_05630 [Maribacter sp.]